MNKKDNLILLMLFMCIIVIIPILSFSKTDVFFSENENRQLQQKPNASIENILSGDFEEKMEKYEDDQIIGRDKWILLKTMIEIGIGKKRINNVYIGDEGYLVEEIGPEDVSYEQFNVNLSAIKTFFVELPKEINSSLMIVPTRQYILKDKLPSNAIKFNEKFYNNKVINGFKNGEYIDLYPLFLRNSDSYIYYKTDHHWTSDGALFAYNKWNKLKKCTTHRRDEFKIVKLTSSFQGSQYSKILYDDGTRDKIFKFVKDGDCDFRVQADGQKIGGIYQNKWLKQKDKYAVFLGGNYGKLEISGGKNNNKRLLMIKDSFGNSFAPFVARDFEKVFMIDLRYFSGNIEKYISANKITDVLVLYSMDNIINDKNIEVLKNKGDVLS